MKPPPSTVAVKGLRNHGASRVSKAGPRQSLPRLLLRKFVATFTCTPRRIWLIPPAWAALWLFAPHERLPTGVPPDLGPHRAVPGRVRRIEEGNSSHGTDGKEASALGGRSHRGCDGRGAFGHHPARARRPGGADTRRRRSRLRQRQLHRDTQGGTNAPSPAGRSIAEKYGARISHAYGTALNGYAVTVDEKQARRLAADSRVASVVQDTRVALDHSQKNPPSWGLDRIDQRGLPLNKSYTWPESAGKGVTAYVIDTGIRITHKDFGGRASYGWDFVGNDKTAKDGNGHGTHVAGTIAGTKYGVAKKTKVVAVRVLDNNGAGTTAQVIAGIDWVTKHAKKPAVANISLGGYANAQLDAAVRNSIASGVTYAVAAGNDGLPAGLYSPPGSNRPSPSARATGPTRGRASRTPAPSLTCSRPEWRSPRRRTPVTRGRRPSRVRRWRARTSRARPRSIWPTTPGPPRHRWAKHWSSRRFQAKFRARVWVRRTGCSRSAPPSTLREQAPASPSPDEAGPVCRHTRE